MTDTLPLWLWLPIGVILWGYLALDSFTRRRRAADADAGRIHRTTDPLCMFYVEPVTEAHKRDYDRARGLCCKACLMWR